MTERELQSTVIEMCRWLGLYVYHTHDSRRSAKGFPDLVIVGPGGVLFRELKSATGNLTGEQVAVIAKLQTAGADATVWRPDDYLHGAVRTELQLIARKART